MQALEHWTFRMTKANLFRLRGYKTARAYSIEADHAPHHTAMEIQPPNAQRGAAYYVAGLTSQKYARQGGGPCCNCDELGQIAMLCPKEHTDYAKFIVHVNQWGRVSLGPRGEDGREISGIRPERRLLSIQVYTREVAQQGDQGWGVANMAETQPPQMQCISRLQMFQRASAQVAAGCAGMAYSCWQWTATTLVRLPVLKVMNRFKKARLKNPVSRMMCTNRG